MPARSPHPKLLTLLALAVLCGCAAPVGVERLSPRAAQVDITQSILTSNEISESSKIVLRRLNLHEKWEDEPEQALAILHERIARPLDRYDSALRASVLDSVAEIYFAYAERSDDSRYYLSAALYAWLYLFPPDDVPSPPDVERGVRLSADIYNRSLTRAFLDRETGDVRFEEGEFELPFGVLDMKFDATGLELDGQRLSHFSPLADLQVHGLKNRYRISGLGAPLAARLSIGSESSEPEGLNSGTVRTEASHAKAADSNGDDHESVFARLRVPVTALLRFDEPATDLQAGRISARLEVIPYFRTDRTMIDGRVVPLESEPSAALALQLTETPPWQREIKGFFQGDLAVFDQGIVSLNPYLPNRIPFVLVHGTASSAGRWADLINDLESDPVFRRNYQIWLFQYNTGNPILYSGWLLKKAIADLVRSVDPNQESAALRDMVVMGHSQGGLLAKLLVVDSGETFWDLVFDEAPGEIELEPDSRELIEGSLLVRPSPYVKRVIFLSTPHHGSVLANLGLANLLGRAVRTPANLLTAFGEIITDDPESKLQRRLNRSSGAVGNMSPNSDFIEILAPLPIAPVVHAHSIMGVKKGPKEEGTDGVVTYESAHLDDVESELVVESGHSSQSNPIVIGEIRRILLEHLSEAIELGIVAPEQE